MLTLLQRLELRRDDAPVHGLGQRDELHLPIEADERQVVSPARGRERGRDDGEAGAELEHDAGDGCRGQRAGELDEAGFISRPARSGRQQQLTAVEKPGHARTVRHMHPAHARIERTAQYLRHPCLHGRHREHLRDGGKRTRGGGKIHTLCPMMRKRRDRLPLILHSSL